MKKIVNERYKESYVEETLSNGLHVVCGKNRIIKNLCL